MSQDIADWRSRAGPARHGAWPPGPRAFPVTSDYAHFARIAARILSCLKYFNINSDPSATAEVLSAYYLFIGVVDNWIDSRAPTDGRSVFDLLETCSDIKLLNEDITTVTIQLRQHLREPDRPKIIGRLRELHDAVVAERFAQSIESYIDHRKTVGRITADVSYLLMRPLLSCDEPALRNFMQRVGAVGCLIDTVIDWRADRRQGLLNFHSTLRDYFILVRAAFVAGVAIAKDHPRLCGLFLQSILDIVRDRLRETSRAAK